MLNLELKVKIDEMEEIRKIISNLSIYSNTFYQKDTYFLTGKKRVKIRESKNNNELIYYIREDSISSKNSRYFLLKINNFIIFLIKKIFKTKVVIEKKRDLYIYKNTRIHLDEVKNLGNFLELETVIKDGSKYKDYEIEHLKLIEHLNLNAMEKIKYSYSDLMMEDNINIITKQIGLKTSFSINIDYLKHLG